MLDEIHREIARESVEFFQIAVPEAELADLKDRLARTRFVDEVGDGWDQGTSTDYLRELCSYWRIGFDWRRQEARLNTFRHFRAQVGGVGLHFVHERGKGPEPIPILLIHGWPDSFARFLKIIPLLTDPRSQGVDSEISFDVVAPSLPGFGFSDRPDKTGLTFEFHELMHQLMTEVLGYDRYAVHGGDFGSMVAEHMARSHGQSLIGIHLTDVPFLHVFQKPDDPSKEEARYLEEMEAFSKKEGAYALVQSTKPLSLAAGLNDSPAGLAAWLLEKFRSWSDCDGNVETRFTRDELLTHIMIYWTTGTIGSSFAPYHDIGSAGALRWISEAAKGWLESKHVPTAFALFPRDLVPAPRAWAERFFDVRRWTEMPRGGHFAALEEPELLASDLRETFSSLWRA